jgi:hypothetical protein
MGAFNGNSGTLYTSSVLPGLQIVSQTPSGVVSNSVNQITLDFSSALNPATVDSNDIALYAPSGLVPASTMAFAFPGASTLLIGLPWQNQPGNYRLEVGPNISDLFGQPMSQVYTGAFTLVIPAITARTMDRSPPPAMPPVLISSASIQAGPVTLSLRLTHSSLCPAREATPTSRPQLPTRIISP